MFSLGWRLSQLPPPAGRTADVTLKTPCLTQWTVLGGAPLGKGHSLWALPINAADGAKTWPLSEAPFSLRAQPFTCLKKKKLNNEPSKHITSFLKPKLHHANVGDAAFAQR